MKKYARQSFYMDVNGLIDQYSSNDSKQFWKLVKFLTKTGGSSSVIPPLLDPVTNNIQIDDNKKSWYFKQVFYGNIYYWRCWNRCTGIRSENRKYN